MAEYAIQVRNPRTLALLGELSNYISATWTRRTLDLGEFEIVVQRSTVQSDLPVRNNIIEILRDGVFEFAGIIRSRLARNTGSNLSQDTFILRGSDLKWWLAGRDIDPRASEFDAQTGVPAETAMRYYIDENLLEAGRTLDDELTGITFANPASAGLGLDVDFNGRWQNLFAGCLVPLARAGDIWHDVVFQTNYAGYSYSIFTYQSTGLVLTLDDAYLLEYVEEFANLMNHLYVLGTGSGAARTVEEVQDAASIAADFRREGHLDAREADTVAKLQQAGEVEISKALEDALSARIDPRIEGNILYRTDWDLGDEVTISIPTLSVSLLQRIAEVRVEIDQMQGEKIAISLGSRTRELSKMLADAFRKGNPVQVE